MTMLPGIDGIAPVGILPMDGCCPPSLCQLDSCALVCNFVQGLPTGPMWDRAKAETLAAYQTPVAGCAPFVCRTSCATIVDHAVYTALRLYDGLMGALYPALREANPYTAHDTLDQWLSRLGWRDCYDCACRNGAVPGLSPIEIWGTIDTEGICEGPICCPQTFSPDLQCAVKRGTVIALHRLTLVPRKTLAALNFVLAPLGAEIQALGSDEIELDPRTCDFDDGRTLCPDNEPPTMKQFHFQVCPTSDTLPKCPVTDCRDGSAQMAWDTIKAAPIGGPTIQAWYEPVQCEGGELAEQIWPGIMAAECIARAVLPSGQKATLQHCSED